MASNSSKKPSSTAKQDYYEILGVSRRATDEEIKKAYRALALQLHPDKNSDPDATTRFQAVGKAYKVLGDPKLRSTYDLLGAQAADMMDQYEDYPGVSGELSTRKKILFALFCCLTGCCCCCLCCGCCCCCNFCCDHCCGICGHSNVPVQPEDEGTRHYSQRTDSIHQQPRNTATDTTKY